MNLECTRYFDLACLLHFLLVIPLNFRLGVTTRSLDTFILCEVLLCVLNGGWLGIANLEGASIALVALVDTDCTLHDTVTVLAKLFCLMLFVDLVDDGALITLEGGLHILGLCKAFVSDAHWRDSIHPDVLLRLYHVIVDQFYFLCSEGALLI